MREVVKEIMGVDLPLGKHFGRWLYNSDKEMYQFADKKLKRRTEVRLNWENEARNV